MDHFLDQSVASFKDISFRKGSQVFYRGIPLHKATIQAIVDQKVYLKYPREKGFLIVPIADCLPV